MILSFGQTWPAFVASAPDVNGNLNPDPAKRVTRRLWKPSTAAKYVAGFEFEAYDTAPFRHGRKIVTGRVRVTAYAEAFSRMTDADYVAEGFAWFHRHPLAIPAQARAETWGADDCAFESFARWRDEGQGSVYVLHYDTIAVEPWAKALLERILRGEIKP